MNKTILQLTLSLALIIALSYSTEAQGVKVLKSTKTEVIDGLTYYLHTVEKGQTIYSLCKAYGVDEHWLYRLNPELKNGLKEGQVLRIPKADKMAVDIGSNTLIKDTLPSEEEGFIFHKVEKGETLYHLMKSYGLPLEKLQEYNPGLSANLKIGQWIKIPTKDQLIKEQAGQLYDSLVDYKLKRRDNYFRLQKKFHITEEELKQLNPSLKNTGLQKGMHIVVPYFAEEPLTRETQLIQWHKDTLISIGDSLKVEKLGCDSADFSHYTFRVGLMMPFYSDLEKDIRVDNPYFMKKPSTYPSFRFIEYYEGFLMALDSLEKMGLKAEVFVFDTKGDTSETRKIIRNAAFDSLDLLFGPFFTRNYAATMPLCRKNNVKVVAPLSEAKGYSSYNNLFIINPVRSIELQALRQYIHDSLPNEELYIIHNGRPSEIEEAEQFRRLAASYLSDTNHLHIYNYREQGFDHLKKDLKKDRKNMLINLVNNEAYISNFLRQLNALHEVYYLTVMGTHSRWKKYKTLETEYLVNMRLTLVSHSFINFQQKAVQDFAHAFYKRYNTDPDEYAYKGFDQAMYFLSLLKTFGPDFSPCMKNFYSDGLQNNYSFQSLNGGAYRNYFLNVYQYDSQYLLIDKRRAFVPYNPEKYHKKEAAEENSEQDKTDDR